MASVKIDPLRTSITLSKTGKSASKISNELGLYSEYVSDAIKRGSMSDRVFKRFVDLMDLPDTCFTTPINNPTENICVRMDNKEYYAPFDIHMWDDHPLNQYERMDVSVNEYGTTIITFYRPITQTLAGVKIGNVFNIRLERGNAPFIVLSHGADTTAVMSLDPLAPKHVIRGHYENSEIRQYLNSTIRDTLTHFMGHWNIVPHTVNLICEDGTHNKAKCFDDISILTTELYRRYRDILPQFKFTIALATERTFADEVMRCFITPSKSIMYGTDDDCNDAKIHPYLILDSRMTVLNAVNASAYREVPYYNFTTD